MTERALKSLRVPVKQLRRECNPAVFKFRTTAELAPIDRVRRGGRLLDDRNRLGPHATGLSCNINHGGCQRRHRLRS